MAAIIPEKQTALEWIEPNKLRLSHFHQEIWNYAETAFREYRSAQAYCALLRSEGFHVEEGTGGMPTAFKATFGEGRPVLGSFVEYDAVPDNSQQPVPVQGPPKGLSSLGAWAHRSPFRPWRRRADGNPGH